MKTYLILFRYTDLGIKNIQDSPNRIKKVKEKLKAMGIEIKQMYALLGQYDTACIISAPDEKAVAKACMQIGAQGYVRSEALQAFPEQEYIEMCGQMA